MLPSFPAPHRAPRSSGAAAQVEVCQTAAGIIQVKGEGRAECAGALLHGLLAARRLAVVTIDLSELRSISSLARGVLVGYCRSVVRSGGRVRLAGVLQPMVSESLGRAELFDLFETSADSGERLRVPCLRREQLRLRDRAVRRWRCGPGLSHESRAEG